MTCPFCDTALPTLRAPRSLSRSPGVRLSRAAMFVLGTGGGAAALGACGEITTSQMYGGPPYDAGPIEQDADPLFPLVDAAYDGPSQDAADANAEDASDASDAADGDADAPY